MGRPLLALAAMPDRATTPGCHPARTRAPCADAASGLAAPGGTTGPQAAKVTTPDGAAGRGGAPQPSQGGGPAEEPQADHETRERFSLPIRRGAAGADRAGRFG